MGVNRPIIINCEVDLMWKLATSHSFAKRYGSSNSGTARSDNKHVGYAIDDPCVKGSAAS